MHTHTLLIADDSIPTQRVIQLTFANETIRVVVAADGPQALAAIEADRPDIILACTSLPGVDGYAIARHVSRQRQLRKVPVLLLRNGFELKDEQKVKKSGANGVLEKPLDPGLVIQLVKHELSLQAAVCAIASEPKPKKARPASPRPPSARRRSALPAAQRVSTRVSKSASRPQPSARRTRGLAGAITPEMLARDVSEAVGQAVGQAIAHAITHVIAEYQRANSLVPEPAYGMAPEPAMQADIESVVINAANDLKPRSLDGPVIVHGDMAFLKQLRRDMGIDDFVLEDALCRAAGPGIPTLTTTAAAAMEREPADVLGAWSEELTWLAGEIGNVRVAPETSAPDSSPDFWTSADNLPQRALPARVGAWLAAFDMRPTLVSFAADAIAWLRSGPSQLFEPFRGGQVRVRTWVVSLAGDLRRS